MNYLSNLTTKKQAWLLLAFSALGLELSALFFQYILDLAPCIMCVYQRLAILAIFAGGAIGTLAPQYMLARLLAYVLWGTGAIWGGIIALEHVEMQENSGSLFFSCEFIPNFPAWAPLHEWIPFLFEATGDCGEISWQFLGYSMPQWMIMVYALYTIAFAVILINRLVCAKKP
ncbi:disulfide bond formation protein DsbB [Colwellia psychrerythraea]|uniref:Disulfide bond formation protein B n=1 Tax=Colwellia psychrerythraea TaxID=28229 RepID=A0A099KZH1_COLPS|nr:disulfide bond formation protein DsbB [Colwellia psychrerythraea]KGJ96104.1 Disulfide bond formation protein B [Colwellia psychrerythraea]